MNRTNDLVEGFLKGAAANGGDPDFFRGYLSYYQGLADQASSWIKQAEEKSGDPEYRLKLAEELIQNAKIKIGNTEAVGAPVGLQGGLGEVLKSIGGLFGGDQSLGGTIAGGGGGALIGLLLSNLLGTDPMTGLLMASILGIGGAGLGNAFGAGKLTGPAAQSKGPGSSATDLKVPAEPTGQTPPVEGEPPAGPIGDEGSVAPDLEAGLRAQNDSASAQDLADSMNFEVVGPAGAPKGNPNPPVLDAPPILQDFMSQGDNAGGTPPGSVVAPSYVQQQPFNMNISNMKEVEKINNAAPSALQAPPMQPIRKPVNLNPAGGPTPGTPPNPMQPAPQMASSGAPKPPQPTVPQMNVGQGKPNAQGIVDPKIVQGQKAQQAVTRIV